MRKSAKLRRQNKREPTAIERFVAKLKGFGRKLKSNLVRLKVKSNTEHLEPKPKAKEQKPEPNTEQVKLEQTKEHPKRRAKGQGHKTNPKGRRSKRKLIIRWLRANLNPGRMTKKKAMLLLGAGCSLALICLIAVLATRASMRNFLERYDGEVFLTGVSIDGVDVSGMTMNQALGELGSHLRTLQGNPVTFSLENGASFSGALRDIGLDIEQMEAVTREALDYGREFSLTRRVRLLRRSQEGRLEIEFPVTYKVSERELTDFLESHMEAHLNTPVNARLESGAEGVRIIPDRIGEVFDVEIAYQEISDYLNTDWNRINASFELEVIEVEAEIVAGQLEGLTDLLGTFTTIMLDDNPSRDQNVATGAGHINHLLMMPGDELSACTLMGPYTEENGYAYGNMFAGNLVVEAIGGGVCQVATTLYMALLYAEIEIVQRNAHTMPVAYVPHSMDAAVAEGILDLRWRNNMSTPIYIESVVVYGETITYNIFGRETRPENRTIEFVSVSEWGDVPEGSQFVASQYGIGAMWLLSDARAPISARLYKVIRIDGEEVDRIRVNSSYYLEAPRIWYVGTGSPNPDFTSLMLGAISSQNYETIRNTINQILAGGVTGGDAGGYTGEYTGSYDGGDAGGVDDGYYGGHGDEYSGSYYGGY